MRVLVCGSRHFDDWDLLCKTMLELGFVGTEKLNDLTIIEGEAKGADFLARVWAKWLGVKIEAYPANWKFLGSKAGLIRNIDMLVKGQPDLVVAFLAPNSRGTKHMIEIAEKAGVEVRIVNI